MANVLVIYFSQSGQQREILDSIVKPFVQQGDYVHFEEVKPVEAFPFPWNGFQFFNAFPETFFQQPLPLQPFSAKAFEEYNLIILGYQPWFLTPSRPISSFLQTEEAKTILKGKPVVTVVGCRNMWLGSQEKVKAKLKEAKGNLVGHIAMADRSSNLVSMVTILRWMFTGKRSPFLFFPKAGVSQADVDHASSFGEQVRLALTKKNFLPLQAELNKLGAVDVKANLVLMEKRGQRGFGIWSKFVAAGGPINSTSRKIRVYTFMYVLPTAIVLLTPLLFIMSKLMLVILRKKLLAEIEYYKGVSLR